ncbi:MAG: hypothetical protein DCC55_16525 [Chloroflexi bacterium]|nr:MAG: hypothetical protein DCC55_16525 [Chloroflexota bacterium]
MTILQRAWRWLGIVPWLLLIVWYLLPTMAVIGQMGRGEPPPADLATYLRAAGRLRAGQPLYATPAEAQQIWLSIHALERANYLADDAAAAAANIPGPYVYPPVLAIWLYWLNFSPAVCMVLLFLAILSFSTLWFYSARAGPGDSVIPYSSRWLLLVVGSWPVLSLLTTAGNVEPVLLFAALVAAWALWRGHALWSAPLIAFVVMVKPFYALFFVAFGLLALVNPDQNRWALLGVLTRSAMITLIVVVVTVVMWGRALWLPTWHFIANALEHHWLVLPVEQQTPLSIWNRTPLQGLVNWGVEPQLAQQLSLGLWVIALLVTLWTCVGRRLTFPLTFALALVLYYWGRPIGWAFYFLEFVVVLAVWPFLWSWQRSALFLGVLALMASHWLALVWTLQGYWLRLVTLQSAEWPWETWLVLPLAWLLLVTAVRQGERVPAPEFVAEPEGG